MPTWLALNQSDTPTDIDKWCPSFSGYALTVMNERQQPGCGDHGREKRSVGFASELRSASFETYFFSMSTISKSEKSYIQTALSSTPPHRADGRGPRDYRAIALETGVSPLANGSARINIGVKTTPEGTGGTEVLAAVKLEVREVAEGDPPERMTCAVTCAPTAYPHLSSGAIDDLSYDFTTLLDQTLGHPTLRPSNLDIIPGRKAWVLYLDVVVVSDFGNIVDALFIAARAALWDTKVPRTRAVEYTRVMPGRPSGDMDVDETTTSAFDTRAQAAQTSATDFELPDFWDEGEVLDGREKWPIPVTLNLLPSVYFLDATLQEEASTPLKLHLMFSISSGGASASLQAMRLAGNGEVNLAKLKGCILDGEKHAHSLAVGLDKKLKDEDIRRGEKARAKFVGGRS